MVRSRFHTQRRIQKSYAQIIGFILLLIVIVFSGNLEPENTIYAQENFPTPTPISYSEYFSVTVFELENGTILGSKIINGPPEPPPGYSLERFSVLLPEPDLESGTNTLTVPASNWSFGCSATSAAMIAAYFDRNGFPDIYTGPTNGGVMPMHNSAFEFWPLWVSGCGQARAQNPLSATHLGLDGQVTKGHVDDYWTCVNSSADDPYIVGSWTEHAPADSTGDFMYTSRSASGLEDGATRFYYKWNEEKLYCSEIEAAGLIDGTLGFKNFYESRGYEVAECYHQETDNHVPGGFSFEDYKAEIDAGQPVMIHVVNHTMVGVGYEDPDTVYLHDTWDFNTHTMTWEGSYSGRILQSVSIVHAILAPEMDLQGNSQSIADDDSTPSTADDTDFGDAVVGVETTPHTFTIENTGTAELNLPGIPKVEITGTHTADFTVTSVPASPVAASGGTTTFEITFDPSAASLREAEISIANDDSDENPYNFAIQGTGTTPEMDVQGKGQSIADEDAVPSLVDDTDFGDAVVGVEITPHTFTIENTGTAELNLTDSPKVNISGTQRLPLRSPLIPARQVCGKPRSVLPMMILMRILTTSLSREQGRLLLTPWLTLTGMGTRT